MSLRRDASAGDWGQARQASDRRTAAKATSPGESGGVLALLVVVDEDEDVVDVVVVVVDVLGCGVAGCEALSVGAVVVDWGELDVSWALGRVLVPVTSSSTSLNAERDDPAAAANAKRSVGTDCTFAGLALPVVLGLVGAVELVLALMPAPALLLSMLAPARVLVASKLPWGVSCWGAVMIGVTAMPCCEIPC